MNLHTNEKTKQKALLVGIDTEDFNAEASMAELYELCESAGAEPAINLIQKRDKPDGAFCVGTGKLEEIKKICKDYEINLIIFDCELTPIQLKNLEKETDVRTIDRTMLILDIFALHARSSEGKLQVELAQLKYMKSRLTGKGVEMSRLGGGIGTRGPGESKLETDRRHIQRRIETLKDELLAISERRSRLRQKRKKDGIITAAIVGYTNAGKSTLMNTLTQAGVLSEDKLFATLDPTSRALKLPNGMSIMLIDTVGLIRRLPHHLVEAFKSTLEEASEADIILNVCDASSEEYKLHLEVTHRLLEQLGRSLHSVITVLNKCDLLQNSDDMPAGRDYVKISAKTGSGIDSLLATIENNLPVPVKLFDALIPYDKSSILSILRSDGTIKNENYENDGIRISILLEKPLWYLIEQYEI